MRFIFLPPQKQGLPMPLGYSFAAGSTRLHSLQNLVDAALARVTVSKNAPAACSSSFIFGFLLKISLE